MKSSAKKIIASCLIALTCLPLPAQTPKILNTGTYIFFLHNKFIEDQGTEGIHPEYGRAEYREIIETFQKQGFIVISQLRPKNTEVKPYAEKVRQQIDSLLKKGVKPGHITVIGTSKGGYIAMQVSGLLKNPEVNFVFIGSCSTSAPEFNICGRILSIYEKSDVIGLSCQPLKEKSDNKISAFKEIELNTGLKHGFLFKALNEWIDPSVQWARQGEER